MENPCKLCGDRVCCVQMCGAKKRYIEETGDKRYGYYEEYQAEYKRIPARKKIVTINKNGIRREEYR